MRRDYNIAKITQPTYSGVFTRKKLFSLLDKCRKKPAVWIAGPPGAGKTVLVSSYLRSRGMPCLWYQLDSGDSDLATFFYYLGLAAGKAVPRKKSLPVLTPENIPGLDVFTRRFFESFYGMLKNPSCVVFDNYQEVPEESPFHDLIRKGLEAVPEGISVTFISRTPPPREFARMRASGSIEIIGWEELTLKPEETSGIIKIRLGSEGRLPRELKGLLEEKANGWAAGLILMLESVKKGNFDVEAGAATSDAIFDYFTSEILGKMDGDTRAFLFKTSVFPKMDSKMAGELTGIGNPGRILSYLSSNNFFTERRLGASPVYQYHPLFQEFLLHKAGEEFGKDEFAEIKKKAALILLDHERPAEAFDLLKETSSWEGIVKLIITNAMSLMEQGRGKVLEAWIESLPKEIVRNSPWLLFWRGVCRLSFAPHEARKPLEAAYELFKKSKDPAGAFLSWSGVVDTFMLERRDFRPLDRWIAEFEGLIKEFDGFPSPEIEDRAASCMFTALMFRQPDHPDLPVWEEKARMITQRSTNDASRMFIGYNLVLFYLWTGRNAKAEFIVNTLSKAFRSPEASTLPQLLWYFSNAIYNYHAARYRSALKYVDEGLKISERTGVRLIDGLLLGAGVLSAIPLHEFDEAERFLGRMSCVLKGVSAVDILFYHHVASLVAMNRGEFNPAIEHAKAAWKMSEEAGFPLLQNIMHYSLANILIEAGRIKGIPRRIEKIRELSRKTRSVLMEYTCLLLEALLAFAKGDEQTGAVKLKKAFTIARAQDLRFYILLTHSTFSRLASRALKAGIEPEFVKNLIRSNNLYPPCCEENVDWPWPVKVYALGGFEIYKDGVKLEFPRKAQQKPLELLKALLSMGGRDVKEELITDELWPDSEGDAAHRAFATTLHRLRSLLENEKALQLREGRLSLDPACCYVDAWALERLLKRTDEKAGNESGCSFEAALESAISMYAGHFLEGEDGRASTLKYREYLKGRLLKHVSRVCESLEEKGELDRARRCLASALKIDPVSEEFCERLMRCHMQAGDRSEALSAYERLKKNLSVTGLSPSAKIRALYKILTSEKCQ